MSDLAKQTKPIRVLQIIGIVCGGGVESVIMNYYRHIDRTKVQFDFIIDGKNKSLLDDEIESLGGKVYHVTPYKENIFQYMYDVYKIMKDNPHEIIHDNMNTMAVFSLLPAWLTGKRVRILHNHTTNAKKDGMKYYMKKFLRPIAPLFANTYMTCSYFAGLWMYGERMMHTGKVKIIKNAIDLGKFAYSSAKRKQIRAELGVKEDTYLIGNVGRLALQKNQEFLIDLFAVYQQINLKSELIIIGEGPLHDKLQQKIKEKGLTDKIKLLGLKTNVCDYYSAMDLFLLPSLYEGLSVVTVEAQANGVPVCVSTEIPEEAVYNNNAVRIDLKASMKIWCESMDDMLRNGRTKLCQMNSNKACFSIHEEAKKIEKIYEKMHGENDG